MLRQALLICGLLLPSASFAQVKMNVPYVSNKHIYHGTHTIIFYKDSSYFAEQRFKNFSMLSFGNWSVCGDTILFDIWGYKKHGAVRSFTATKIPGDSVYVQVLDKNDIDITGMVELALWVGKENTMFNFRPSKIRQSVHNHPGGRLYFKTVEDEFLGEVNLKTDSCNNFIVRLNIPGEFFIYPEVAWSHIDEDMLLIKKDKLKGILIREEFKVPRKNRKR